MPTTMTPQYDTMLFTDIFDDAADFVAQYKASGLYDSNNKIADASATKLFWLIFAKYGNSPVANLDLNMTKYKIWSIIYQYGPCWEKELAVQSSIRSLSDSDIQAGSKLIANQALNPESTPTTADLTELQYINQQNTTNQKRGKLEGYAYLLSVLKTDVTGAFIDKFKIVFKQFVMPENPLLYVTESEGD